MRAGAIATSFWLDYADRIWRLRYFWTSLIVKDLRARYKNSVLGIGWSLLRPLAMTVVFCVVFAELFHLKVGDYAPFLLTGLTTWQFFTECTLSGCLSFFMGSAYIRQQPLPLAIFPLRTVLGAGLHALIGMALALVVTGLFRGFPNPLALLWLLPVILICLVLGWSAAIICGMTHVHFPDTTHLLEITINILFYATPVLYPPGNFASRRTFGWILQFNPLTHLLALIRDPIMTGEPAPLGSYVVVCAFALLSVYIASMCLRKLEKQLVFWI
jgi:ABC-type polysaccharide/polyol phosphate export permease